MEDLTFSEYLAEHETWMETCHLMTWEEKLAGTNKAEAVKVVQSDCMDILPRITPQGLALILTLDMMGQITQYIVSLNKSPYLYTIDGMGNADKLTCFYLAD